MIMGNKIVKIEDALVTIGGYILSLLQDNEMSIDSLYSKFKEIYPKKISFEEFVYSIDFLFMINRIEIAKSDYIRIKDETDSTN